MTQEEKIEFKNKEVYTLSDLVSFGNYLLSDFRDRTIEKETNKQVVGDWDISNWINEQMK